MQHTVAVAGSKFEKRNKPSVCVCVIYKYTRVLFSSDDVCGLVCVCFSLCVVYAANEVICVNVCVVLT